MAKRDTQILISKPWNKSLVKQLKMSYGSIDYVEHTQVTQKLIALIPDVKMEVGEIIKDVVFDENGEQREFITGVTYTISGTIDGEFRSVTEAGMCDKPFFVEGGKKVSNNGERLKECISDAIKRCGMRLGLGLELWDTEVWLIDYLDPKTKAEPKSKKETKTDDKLKVSKDKLDKIIDKEKAKSPSK